LRERLAGVVRDAGAELYFPRADFCTDNGAMIALAGALRLRAGLHDDAAIKVSPRWDIESLATLELA